jgi:hypothetical protein
MNIFLYKAMRKESQDPSVLAHDPEDMIPEEMSKSASTPSPKIVKKTGPSSSRKKLHWKPLSEQQFSEDSIWGSNAVQDGATPTFLFHTILYL